MRRLPKTSPDVIVLSCYGLVGKKKMFCPNDFACSFFRLKLHLHGQNTHGEKGKKENPTVRAKRRVVKNTQNTLASLNGKNIITNKNKMDILKFG